MDLPTPEFSEGFNFDKLKFRAAETNEVTSFRWFGGQVISGTAMDVDDLEGKFNDLSFLVLP